MNNYGLLVELGGRLKIPPGLGLLRRGQERFKLRGLLRGRKAWQNPERQTTDNDSRRNFAHASPVKLQCCLHLSRCPRLSNGSIVSRGGRGSHKCIRAVKVGVIQSIEHIEAELHPHAFPNREILLNADVPISIS